MVPPRWIVTAYYTPLSHWKVKEEFDSEASCKQAQAMYQQGLRQKPMMQRLPSTCIASDDLRLSGN
jgi:hypothetical protein